MKIAVSKLRPNPFRRMKSYPLDKTKVERLKTSIQETSFWDNVLARPHPTKPGKYQIAYGHHRLTAIQELGIQEVDIPVRDLDDATMVRIMANENLEWVTSPAVVNATVGIAKDFLDKELAKYATWEEVEAKKALIVKGLFTGWDPVMKRIIPNPKASFGQAKGQGVGGATILKFLGGNWKEWMVQEALSTFSEDKKGTIDREAVEIIPTMDQARHFKKAVKDYNIPKKDQKKIAKKIRDEGIGRRDIQTTVRRSAKKLPKQDPEVSKLEKKFEDINQTAKGLNNKIWEFQKDLEELEVTQLTGVQAFLILVSLKDLTDTINSFGLFATNKGAVKQIEGSTKGHTKKVHAEVMEKKDENV